MTVYMTEGASHAIRRENDENVSVIGSEQRGYSRSASSLPAKIILSAFVLLAALTQAARRAPVGYRGREGFSPYQRATSCDKGAGPAARGEKNVDGLALSRFTPAGEGLNSF